MKLEFSLSLRLQLKKEQEKESFLQEGVKEGAGAKQ